MQGPESLPLPPVAVSGVACERCQQRPVFRHDTNGQQVCKQCLVEAHTPVRCLPLIGRNEACWCGSGRKFKRCHGGQGGRPAMPVVVAA